MLRSVGTRQLRGTPRIPIAGTQMAAEGELRSAEVFVYKTFHDFVPLMECSKATQRMLSVLRRTGKHDESA